jgi:hemolysin III
MSGVITGSVKPRLKAEQHTPAILRGDDDLPHVLADTVTDFFHAPRARGLIHVVCAI